MVKEKEELLEDEEVWDDEEEMNVPALVTKIDGVQLPAGWGQSATNMDEVRKHRQSFNLKHGMFANVPMVCKGADCPMSEVCTVAMQNRPIGQRCPIEIAAIIDRYDKYCEQLGLGPEDYFDLSQVKDLVDIEVKLLRANGQLAISGNFIEQVVTGIDDQGNAHLRPELHKATEYEEKLLSRKSKILADLNATRKANKSDTSVDDPSSFAASLMNRMKKAKQMTVIDVEDENVVDDSTNGGDQ